MRILAVNAGSSSLKLSLIGAGDQTLASTEIETTAQSRIEPGTLRRVFGDGFGGADAAAHRIVHGGERYRAAVRVDPEVRAELGRLCSLAPLHQPKSLAALDAVSQALPDLPTVACFDTAFHASMPAAAATYALPQAWRERWGLRRYGFHGLSHAYCARRVPELTAGAGRIVCCHLGAGASLCAILDGRSVETTMGFSPLEGLVMATRSGSVDPGLLLWLLEHGRMSETQLAAALEYESGLRGLAGSGDMRVVLRQAAAGEPAAVLAREVYLHRLRAAIAAMAAALGGIDALVFTGGVGENAPAVREAAVAGLGFLGLELDGHSNAGSTGDGVISPDGAPVAVLVVHTREDLELARQSRRVLAR